MFIKTPNGSAATPRWSAMAPRVSLLLSLVLSSLLLLLLFPSRATSPFGSFKLESFGSFKHLEGSEKKETITKGFDAWAGVPNFTFDRVRDEIFAKIRVYFQVRDKGTLRYPLMGLEESWLTPNHHWIMQPSISMEKRSWGWLISRLYWFADCCYPWTKPYSRTCSQSSSGCHHVSVHWVRTGQAFHSIFWGNKITPILFPHRNQLLRIKIIIGWKNRRRIGSWFLAGWLVFWWRDILNCSSRSHGRIFDGDKRIS